MRLHLHQAAKNGRHESPQRRAYTAQSVRRVSPQENNQRPRLSHRIGVAGVDESQVHIRGLRQGAGYVRILLLHRLGARRRKRTYNGYASKIIRRGIVDREEASENQRTVQD